MIEILLDVLEQFPRGLVYVAMGVVVLVIARFAQDLTTPYKINDQLNHKDNVALALSISGYYLGVIIVFLGALYQPFAVIADDSFAFTAGYWEEAGLVFAYSVVGIIVLNVARIVVDRLVLYDFSAVEEIVEDQNAGTGAVECAVYVAVGLVIAGSVSGESGGPETAAAFLVLGLAALIIYTLFYEWTTSFSIHDEIEKDNVAVGVALAGNLIAISIVVFKAVFGEFVGWSESLIGFFAYAIIGFILLYAIRFVVDLVLFRNVSLSDELAVDRNLGAAFIESAALISVSLILFFAI